MSIEHSDEQVEEVVGDIAEESAGGDEAVEIDADSLAAAAQSAGITDADVVEEVLTADEQDDKSEESGATEDAVETAAVEADAEAKETSVPDEEADAGDDSAETEEGEKADETDEAEGDAAVETESEADSANEEEKQEDEIVTSVSTDDGVEVTVESVVESILFASDEPITPNRLVNILETGSVKQVRDCIKNLNEKYEANNLAFRIERIAGGYQMMTLDAYNHWLRKMIRVRADNKLTQAALETLAIVAYKQPIIRADVEGIRGVSSGEMIRSLMYKGLVRITGRAEVLGRPMLYGTTKKFLDVFGLNSPKDLPKLDELKKPQE